MLYNRKIARKTIRTRLRKEAEGAILKQMSSIRDLSTRALHSRHGRGELPSAIQKQQELPHSITVPDTGVRTNLNELAKVREESQDNMDGEDEEELDMESLGEAQGGSRKEPLNGKTYRKMLSSNATATRERPRAMPRNEQSLLSPGLPW